MYIDFIQFAANTIEMNTSLFCIALVTYICTYNVGFHFRSLICDIYHIASTIQLVHVFIYCIYTLLQTIKWICRMLSISSAPQLFGYGTRTRTSARA